MELESQGFTYEALMQFTQLVRKHGGMAKVLELLERYESGNAVLQENIDFRKEKMQLASDLDNLRSSIESLKPCYESTVRLMTEYGFTDDLFRLFLELAGKYGEAQETMDTVNIYNSLRAIELEIQIKQNELDALETQVDLAQAELKANQTVLGMVNESLGALHGDYEKSRALSTAYMLLFESLPSTVEPTDVFKLLAALLNGVQRYLRDNREISNISIVEINVKTLRDICLDRLKV